MCKFRKSSKKFHELAKKASGLFAGVKDKELANGLIHLTKALEELEHELQKLYEKLK